MVPSQNARVLPPECTCVVCATPDLCKALWQQAEHVSKLMSCIHLDACLAANRIATHGVPVCEREVQDHAIANAIELAPERRDARGLVRDADPHALAIPRTSHPTDERERRVRAPGLVDRLL